MAERVTRRWRVVSGARGQLGVLGRERRKRLVGNRTPGKRRAPRLVGERHHHRRIDDLTERLDRVELQPVEIVEPIEQHRRAPPERRPAAGQFVQGTHRLLLAIDTPDLLQRTVVLLKQPTQLDPERSATVRRPLFKRGAQPCRRQAAHLQFGDERGQRTHEPRRRLRGGAASRNRREHAFARPGAQHRPPHTGSANRLADQPGKPLHARADQRSPCAQLAPVLLGVRARRHDQQRLASVGEVLAHRIQHHLGLARVPGRR